MKRTLRWAPALAVALLALSTAGCSLADNMILGKMRAYWPGVELAHPKPDTVQLETGMSGVSDKFLAQTFEGILKQYGPELRQAFSLLGYKSLILGAGEWHLVWSIERERYWVLPPDTYARLCAASRFPTEPEYRQ